MKRLIAAAILTVFVVAACVGDIILANKVVKELSNDIEQCVTAAENNDFSLAAEHSKKLEEKWENVESYFSFFINHGLIDEMGVSVAKLEPLARVQSDMYLTECRVIEVKLTHIKNDSRFNLHNLF